MAYTTYPPHLHKFFSMCVRFTKSNREISCTGWTTNVARTVYVLGTVRITFSIIWMWIFCIHSCRIATIDIWIVIRATNVARFRFTASSCPETSSVPGTVGNLSLTVLEKRRLFTCCTMGSISVGQQKHIQFMFPITVFVNSSLYSFLNNAINSLNLPIRRAP